MGHLRKIRIADKTSMAFYYFTQLPDIEESTCGVIAQQEEQVGQGAKNMSWNHNSLLLLWDQV